MYKKEQKIAIIRKLTVHSKEGIYIHSGELGDDTEMHIYINNENEVTQRSKFDRVTPSYNNLYDRGGVWKKKETLGERQQWVEIQTQSP